MAFDFGVFGRSGPPGRPALDEAYVDWLVNEQSLAQMLHFQRLWGYYRNPMQEPYSSGMADAQPETARSYLQWQEYGLPSRITGMRYGYFGDTVTATPAGQIQRKEVVIENDIAWRIDTMVDFLFGKNIQIRSQACDRERARQITRILQAVFEANGGASWLQQLALLGSVYGFVDVILRHGAAEKRERLDDFEEVVQAARGLFLETIAAPRSVPILDERNYRQMHYFIQHYWQGRHELAEYGEPAPLVNNRGHHIRRQKVSHYVEVLGADFWQRYREGELIATGPNLLGELPVVHIQNMPQPEHYEGQSDVEPLIGLQDELNTRLSDRASRITFQSFKMYLGKGIEGFEERQVGPGRMWSTHNPDAKIEEFGGDPGSPSEDMHINHIREALDKASGVASVAAGILKGRVGNLTSAVALKVTLMGVLAKTERKRRSYGKGLADICRLTLHAFDKLEIFPNEPEEREIEINWPGPLPENLLEKLQEAKLKQDIGVPTEKILQELGYE